MNFVDHIEFIFKKCIIRYTCISICNEKSLNKLIKKERTTFDISFLSNNVVSELYGCIIEADEKIMDVENSRSWINGVQKMENCTARNLYTPFEPAFIYGNEPVKSVITNSRFVNCHGVISGGPYRPCIITDCVFENCFDVLSLANRSKVSYCQFIGCGDLLFNTSLGDVTVEKCEFYNVKQPKNPEEFGYMVNRWGICLSRTSDTDGVLLRHCVFDGINHAGFITYSNEEKPLFAKCSTYIGVENCVFKHCVAGVIDKENHHLNNSKTAITIKDCTGLEGTGGGEAENPVIWQRSTTDEPIGASIEESEIGVPIYQTA